MKQLSTFHSIKRSLVFMLCVMLLAGCSVPFFGSEAAPQIVPQTGRELVFQTYTHPEWGYSIDIPQGASVTQSRDGRTTTIAYADDTIVRGRYVTQVEVIPQIGADMTPEQILEQAATRLSETPTPEPLSGDGVALPAAQISFQTSKGEVCQDRNAVMAAYTAGETGYLVRVTSDGLNRCDTGALPETEQILASFRAGS